MLCFRHDFDSCQTEDVVNFKTTKKVSKYFVICDPTEKELCQFADNTLSIVMGGVSEAKKDIDTSNAVILSVYKPVGSTSIPDDVLDQCIELALKQKCEIDDILQTNDK